jgi:hypothetical protein
MLPANAKHMKIIPAVLMTALCAVTVTMAQPASAFTATGSMITPRFGHTATLLSNGKVLIAGGFTLCAGYLPESLPFPHCQNAAAAELYDPVTGTFAAAGPMNLAVPIGGALLPDGRVLFAQFAPTSGGGTLAIIELYDPSTGNFDVAGSAATLTSVYSATLLTDGRVLLVGSAGKVPAAELYDPVSNSSNPPASFPPAAPFAVLFDGRVMCDDGTIWDPSTGVVLAIAANYFHDLSSSPSGALLQNGNLLLTGGATEQGSVDWASLFDPASGTFSETATMSMIRSGQTASLLPDGTVLIAGGAGVWDAETLSTLATASAELYDPGAGRFFPTASMNTPRFSHTAVVLNNGQVLITGGATLAGPQGPPLFNPTAAIASAELYTPDILIPAPALFSVSGDGRGQGAIWDAGTGQIASPSSPAVAGEVLSMYTTSLADRCVIPPQVVIGGRLAEVLFFGAAPGYPGYYQVNFRVPAGVAPGAAVSVRLIYFGRSSNEVTIGAK